MRISTKASVRLSAAAMVSLGVRAISQAGQYVAASTGPKTSGIDVAILDSRCRKVMRRLWEYEEGYNWR